MIRFSQRLGSYLGIHLIPSTETLTAEDHRHPDSIIQPLQSNFENDVELIGAAFQPGTSNNGSASTMTIDQHNVNNREIDLNQQIEFQSPPFSSQVVEQGIAKIFQDAHHFSISGNARIVNIGQQVINQGTHGLDIMKDFVSFSAFHDSSTQDPERCCYPGTRKNVLDEVHTWIDDPDTPERILWLNGPAGVGKSAIAQTISNLYDRDIVGATFFFFRSDPGRNDGNRVFPTLAWRLASSVPSVKEFIAFSLEEDPDLARKNIEAQFNLLIARPFLTISDGSPTSTRIIIIDGLDECSDMKLQRRILKIIGNAISDTQFPLRFIISCRPESHIKDFFTKFEHPILEIDLAKVDGTYRDIEIYLTSEFGRIAVDQGLNPNVWPGQAIINTLVFQSSAQFVYAATIIKYVSDEYESAVAQLNVILGLKPNTGQSPFSELGALYLEILRRQPDKTFLMNFLAVLVARSAPTLRNLHEDDEFILDLDEEELHRKLRGMRSLLKTEDFIDVHHKSFLDFLQDPSRSAEYHVSKQFANRRYMELITDALVKSAAKLMKQPDTHEGRHFTPSFAYLFNRLPFGIDLQTSELEEILQPLQAIQETLLQLSDMSVPWKPRACAKCWTFNIIDELRLQLAWMRGTTQLQESKYIGIHPLTTTEVKQDIPPYDLDTCLSLLLAGLRVAEVLLNKETVGLMRALIRFDPTETAMKIRTIADAQNLAELVVCLNKNRCFDSWFGSAAPNITRLAILIYGRVPLLPRSLFLNSAEFDGDENIYQGQAVNIRKTYASFSRGCFDAFLWACLSHDDMGPFLGICHFKWNIGEVFASAEMSTMHQWRQSCNPSVSKIQQIFYAIAKSIQYVHSLHVTLSTHRFSEDSSYFYIDGDSQAKVQCPCFCPMDLRAEPQNYGNYDGSTRTVEDNIRWFGAVFYEVVFNKSIDHRKDDGTVKIRPSEPDIPGNLWELIQWCCANDPKERPTMDEIVKEMESWISLGQFTLS